MLITAIHNGGLVAGAFTGDRLIGFIFGFPGIEFTPDGPRPKHCSHMMGIHPDHRDSGVGFALKRAQWQMVRHQGLDHITWTYDPLLSRNAYLNITKLGAVCSHYRRSEYGDMRDGLNAGLPSDRFQVDWWINTRRVERRLGKRARRPLKLENFAKAELQPLYPLQTDDKGWLRPPEHSSPLEGRLSLLKSLPISPRSRMPTFPWHATGASSRVRSSKQHSLPAISSPILCTTTGAAFMSCPTVKARSNINRAPLSILRFISVFRPDRDE
jgi:GNAT superfamily N-acetyltransferase